MGMGGHNSDTLDLESEVLPLYMVANGLLLPLCGSLDKQTIFLLSEIVWFSTVCK